jgi:hypothetical protein
MTEQEVALIQNALYFISRAPCKEEQYMARVACMDWLEGLLKKGLEDKPNG